ncbi:MAG: ABC transporter substrate-binding protein [Deltaproteobacteria bacterium]|nr:ABC transporter substrate-binding protein [Deltaproteobacteria bacterium]
MSTQILPGKKGNTKPFRGFVFVFIAMLILLWSETGRAEEIVIGFSGPLSGLGAEFGSDCVNGVEMAVNEINGTGGISVQGKTYTFRLEKLDDKVNPETAVQNALRMRRDHKAIAVFNPVFTTIAPLMQINTKPGNAFIIMAYTSVPQVMEMNNPLTIVTVQSFKVYARIEADVAWKKGWRKAAIVVTSGRYGDMWRQYFRQEWEKKGGVVTVDKSTNYYARTDFAAPLEEALATNPDFILIGGPSATTALIIEQARSKGFEGGFLLIEQAKLDAIRSVMVKPLGMEGCIGVARVSDVPFAVSDKFTSAYLAKYKRSLTWEAVNNYAGMYALARAIVAAGTASDVRAIRAAFPKAFPVLGDRYPMEIYGITSAGRFITAAVAQEVKHGRFRQPAAYVWWAKTRKEFDRIVKITKSTTPVFWLRMDEP